MDISQITSVISSLREAITKADNAFDEAVNSPASRDDDRDSENANWLIEIVFLRLIVACDALGLPTLREMVITTLCEAKSSTHGLSKGDDGPDGWHYSVWLSTARQYLSAIDTLAQPQRIHSLTRDLTDIIRAAVYPICDQKLFGSTPRNEEDVHFRLEGVLKCVFPDLKHKPTLSKPIKNYEPDTGLPSIRTLVEYKFIDSPSKVPRVADEIFADTRGYMSAEWDTFLYVVYETRRFQPETQWQALLKSGGVGENTQIIVLSGESVAERSLRTAHSPV